MLLIALTGIGASRNCKSMCCSLDETRSGFIWLLRRRWDMTTIREHARLLLARMEFVGRGAGAAAARRQAAEHDNAARARRAACARF